MRGKLARQSEQTDGETLSKTGSVVLLIDSTCPRRQLVDYIWIQPCRYCDK